MKKLLWTLVTLLSLAALVVGVGVVRPETPVAGPAAERAVILGKALLGDDRSQENVVKMARNARPLTTYYQYTDDSGRVHFAAKRSDVPERWRSRVGTVQMASPPPLTPAEARATREAQTIANAPPPIKVVPRVIVYTAVWDENCQDMLKWLDAHDITYINKDVDEQPRNRKELQDKTGGDYLPSYEINGQIYKGFSRLRFKRAYAEASKISG